MIADHSTRHEGRSMQTQAPENVATTEQNEQVDARERQPYQEPCLVRLDLSETQGSTGLITDGITQS